MRNIKKNDEVIVTAGKDKGKRGKVLRILPLRERAYVEGINLIKKHVKPNPRTNEAGGVVTREASIHISNLAIYNPVTKKADRVKIKFINGADNTQRKVRCFKSTDELIDI